MHEVIRIDLPLTTYGPLVWKRDTQYMLRSIDYMDIYQVLGRLLFANAPIWTYAT